MDLTITAFERFISENCHAKFGGNWTTNKGEIAYIITKYPRLNRVKLASDKCKVKRLLNNVGTKYYYDTCAQVCLIPEDWLQRYLPHVVVKPVKEILDDQRQ